VCARKGEGQEEDGTFEGDHNDEGDQRKRKKRREGNATAKASCQVREVAWRGLADLDGECDREREETEGIIEGGRRRACWARASTGRVRL
jgi:hypothetical protein